MCPAPASPPPRLDAVGLGVIAAVGAGLSLALTGFSFGISNNLFHLPIVAALFDEPQFAGDAFIQSLRFFAAGPWLVLTGSARWIDPWWLFLGLDILSRFLAFFGFLLCAHPLGVTSTGQRAVFAGLLCLSSLLRIDSYAGGAGLFINYFTHSEIANGLTLIMLFFAAQGRLLPAFAMNGVVFFVNAFVAVWNAAPLGLMVVALLAERRLGWRRAVRDGALGLAVFLVLAAPVILNVLSNPEFGTAPTREYIEFLNQYWPFHFLFTANPWSGRIALAAVLALGVAALAILGRPARPFLLALGGFAAVYAIGIILPSLTHAPALLNLHLLRAGGMIHLLAVLGASAVVVRWLSDSDRRRAVVLAPLLAVLLCSHRYLAGLAPLLLLFGHLPATLRLVPASLTSGWLRADRIALAAVLAFWVLVQLPEVVQRQRADAATAAEWSALGDWAKTHTAPDALFLVATNNTSLRMFRGEAVPADAGDPALLESTMTFEYRSHRRVWVDFKRGAAVMWSPGYDDIWWPRVSAVLALPDHAARLAYARARGIEYVIEACAPAVAAPPVTRTARLCVYAANVRSG